MVSSTSLVKLGRHPLKQGTSGGSMVKNLPANAGDMGPIPGPGKSAPHATGQLSPCPTTSLYSRARDHNY